MLKLNLIHTGAFLGIVLFIGYGLGRVVRPLESLNIPAPVVGGLVIALMTLKLWELAGLMLPLFIILLGQIVLVGSAALLAAYPSMGRNYQAAVISGGFCGFMMGTTANAMTSMQTIVERYGRSRHAFLVVSMVGAFFIDFTNAVIITIFMNIFK
ncbi:MAG: sodium/glutamate symporter [Candidatus Aminicenantales bacterium]